MTVSYRNFFKVPTFARMLIYTNNYCNLKCEHCATLSNLPISPDSEYLKRRERYEIPVSDVELFCERFKGIGENDLHRLEGGEPTAMPLEKMDELLEVLSAYGRRISIMTNGYNLIGFGKKRLNKFHQISLDDHGINHGLLTKCRKYLKTFYRGQIEQITVSTHYDLPYAKQHPKNRGITCGIMLKLFELYHGVLFPCCILPFIEEFDKSNLISDTLRNAGWHIGNSNVVNQMRRWRRTLPKYVHHTCLYNCWFPHVKVGKGRKITLKPGDILQKRAQ